MRDKNERGRTRIPSSRTTGALVVYGAFLTSSASKAN